MSVADVEAPFVRPRVCIDASRILVAFRTHKHLPQVERDDPRVIPQLHPRRVKCELEQSSTTICTRCKQYVRRRGHW
jgi:hypothetical protein